MIMMMTTGDGVDPMCNEGGGGVGLFSRRNGWYQWKIQHHSGRGEYDVVYNDSPNIPNMSSVTRKRLARQHHFAEPWNGRACSVLAPQDAGRQCRGGHTRWREEQ
jgi:hypothetical protein